MSAATLETPVWETLSCGSLGVVLAGTEVALRASGALWIEGERALVAADLHLEKGSAFAARGQMLPPYDTRETLARLEREIASLSPRIVILAGDTLHDRRAAARIAADDRARLAMLAQGRALVRIAGNHDPDRVAGLAGDMTGELRLAGLVIRHEPAPDAADAAGEVAGHLHPCAVLRGAAGRVRRRCFVTDGARLVLPAFGAFAGGLNVRDPAIAGLFPRPPLVAALGRGAHPIPWRMLSPDVRPAARRRAPEHRRGSGFRPE